MKSGVGRVQGINFAFLPLFYPGFLTRRGEPSSLIA